MRVKRVIFVYDKWTETLIGEIPIDMSIEFLRSVFTPFDNDPDLIMSYDVTVEQVVILKHLENIRFNFENNIYQMECYKE